MTTFRFVVAQNGIGKFTTPAETTWATFLELLRTMAAEYVNDDKSAVPLLYPFVRRADARGVSQAAIEAHTCGLYDVDDAEPAFALETLERLRARKHAFAFWTTHSNHAKGTPRGKVRFRVLVPWAGSVTPSRWANARARDMADLGLAEAIDGNTLRETQPGFLPARPTGAPPPILAVADGAFIDPFSLTDTAEVSSGSLLLLARVLKRVSGKDRDVGAAIAEALGPHQAPFADPGGRDTMAWRIASRLANEYPDADPFAVARLFAPSCALMDPNAYERLREKFARAWGGLLTHRGNAVDHMATFWGLHGQPGREEPYTSDEREDIAERYSADGGVRWILAASDGVSFLTIDGYTPPVHPHVGLPAATVQLAPSPVRLRRADGAPRELRDLVDAYGSHLARCEWSLYPLEKDFDPRTSTLTMCQSPIRACMTPLRDPLVEEWIGALCGPGESGHRNATLLIRWLSLLPDLRQILSALFLSGCPGAGKNLFAVGLSALWSASGPTPLAAMLGDWTDPMLRCPLGFGDEFFPHDRHGRPMTAEFRELIGTLTHPYKAKYKAESRINGAVRVILAANNENMLALSENLTDNDIRAIAMRIIRIVVHEEATRLLDSLPHERKMGLAAEGFARHTMYLATSPLRKSRFGVESDDQSFTDALMVGTGHRTTICQHACKWLVERRALGGGPVVYRLRAGGLDVSIAGLWAAWDRDHDGPKPRAVAALAAALKGLAVGDASGGWYRFNPDRLYAWAALTGVYTAEQLRAALAGGETLAQVIPIKKFEVAPVPLVSDPILDRGI